MSELIECKHEEIETAINVIRFEQGPEAVLELQIRCQKCKEPYVFDKFKIDPSQQYIGLVTVPVSKQKQTPSIILKPQG